MKQASNNSVAKNPGLSQNLGLSTKPVGLPGDCGQPAPQSLQVGLLKKCVWEKGFSHQLGRGRQAHLDQLLHLPLVCNGLLCCRDEGQGQQHAESQLVGAALLHLGQHLRVGCTTPTAAPTSTRLSVYQDQEQMQ